MSERRFFINEHSVVEQAEHEHAAGMILVALAASLRAANRLGQATFFRSHALGEKLLLSPETVGDPPSDQRRRSFRQCLLLLRSSEQQAIREFLLQMVSKAPWSEELLESDWPEHRCHHVKGAARTDVTNSSLAAAAVLDGALVSLRECDDFPSGSVSLCFLERKDSAERGLEVPNFVEAADVEAIRRIFEPNPKHRGVPREAGDVRVSAMDLSSETAQAILDRAETIPGERRLFAFHEGKLYVFVEHLRLRFHGHRVEDPDEFQRRDADVYNHLRRLGWVR